MFRTEPLLRLPEESNSDIADIKEIVDQVVRVLGPVSPKAEEVGVEVPRFRGRRRDDFMD